MKEEFGVKDMKGVRYIKIGSLPTGKMNLLTDVPGVKVGHKTYCDDDKNTGITAILPHGGNLFKEKVMAGHHIFNGFGKPLGLVQLGELGLIESPILLTNTLSVGVVANGLISYMLEENPEIGVSTGTINPLVLECNDGELNNIRNIFMKKQDVYDAIKDAKKEFLQGSIGAGTGMTCLGFKGGIGSSSRVIRINNREYILGVLVNSNFQGSSSKELKIKGHRIGELLAREQKGLEDQGSIIVIIATDLPLNSLQLTRIAKRAEIGIGNAGGYASHGSGDIIIAFSTKNNIPHFPQEEILEYKFLHDNNLNIVFRAVVEATEESIINSLLSAKAIVGYKNNSYRALNEHHELFKNLLIGNTNNV